MTSSLNLQVADVISQLAGVKMGAGILLNGHFIANVTDQFLCEHIVPLGTLLYGKKGVLNGY